MNITLIGQNELLLKRRLEDLVSKFSKVHGEHSVESLDAEELSDNVVLDKIKNLPFLTNKRLIVLSNLSKNKQLLGSIEQIISSIDKTTDLIIFEPKMDKRTSLFKLLKTDTDLEEYNILEAPDLVEWLIAEADQKGGKISSKDASYLVDRIGQDQFLLASELQKLITYNPNVERQTIDLLTDVSPQSKIFEVLDAAFNHQVKEALKYYDEQRTQNVNPQVILAMLIWQLQLISILKFSKAKSNQVIARDFGMSLFPISKARNLSSKIAYPKLTKMINDVFTIDLKYKTKGIDLDQALKVYLATL